MKLKNIIQIGSFVVAGVAPMTSSTASASDYMCLACPAGTYSNGGSTSCTPCPAGTYSNAVATSCTKCPIGTYSSNKGSASCTNCPTGYPTKSIGSTSEKDCVKPCYESITLYKGSCSSSRLNISTIRISCYQSVELNGTYSTSSSAFSCKQKCHGHDDNWCSYSLKGGTSYRGTYTNVDGTLESFINSKQ